MKRFEIDWKKVLILLAATILVLGGSLVYSAFYYAIGFPLDDAWIHQTYARNLAQFGEWSFIPGTPSAGSTSPLWTVLLAVGYWLSIEPHFWAYFLGGVCLCGLSLIGESIFEIYFPDLKAGIPWFGLFLIFEWHLDWAALSGMETLLHSMSILLLFYLLSRERPHWGWVGLLVGLTVWVRPDGITLLGPAVFVLILGQEYFDTKRQHLLYLLLGFLAGFLPYLLFNNLLSGHFWPNTFYAKQQEYAALYQIPLLERFLTLAGLPLIGAGALILPGFIKALWKAVKDRNWVLISAGLWWLGYTLIYALRLPVNYQHGRYLIPAMPVYFLLSGIGFIQILKEINSDRLLLRVLKNSWIISICMVGTAFTLNGFKTYAVDVSIIESEMVAAAQWVQGNTEPDALIAAHDIGALGYFAQRDIIDLAGLISPDVIPFIRDEDKLAAYIRKQDVDYLVIFPDWYVQLPQMGSPVYITGAGFSPAAGGENMVIYGLK